MKTTKIVLLCFAMALALFCSATANAQCSLVYIGQDTTTGGDWDGVTNPLNPVGSPIGVYGSYAHILPGPCELGDETPLGPFEVPLGEYEPGELPGLLMDFPFLWTLEQVNGLPCYAPDPPYNDEYESEDPPVTYLVRGTVVGPTGEAPPLDYIQHPAFTWGWEPWHGTQTEFREVYYRVLGGADHWLKACWDDGGERCFPENGYMDFELYFPPGPYMLSLYAYHEEADGSRTSQEYQIWNQAMTMQLLASETISGSEYINGIYKIFGIYAGEGGCTIIVRVNNDTGHSSQVNIILSGIFVDKFSFPGHTIGWWKNNVDKNLQKNGHAQLTATDMLFLLGEIDVPECAAVFEGLTLEQASEIFNNHKKEDLPKAQAQILALLLSAEYFSIGDPDYLANLIVLPDVGQDGGAFYGTLGEAIELILDEYCDGNYGVAHELATILNEME